MGGSAAAAYDTPHSIVQPALAVSPRIGKKADVPRQPNLKGIRMFTHIILPTDGSETATGAVNSGIELAQRLGAKVTLVTVVKASHVGDASGAHAEAALAAGATKAEAAGVEAAKVTRIGDDPAAEIMAAAAEAGGDLIAMASHGRQGMAAVIIGSQTDQVIKHSKIPVLVYR